jgi:hypothetical protein
MAKCIYCDKTDTLNTQLTVKLEDDTKITVDICDDHAEDATVKTARMAYVEHQAKIEEFMAQAKALGLNISDGNSGLAIASAPEAHSQAAGGMVQQELSKAPAPENLNPLAGVTQEEQEEGWVDSGKVDGQSGMQSAGGSAGGTRVSGHSSHQVGGGKDVLASGVRRGKVQMQMTEGRTGQPLAIPGKRVDGTGTTRIRIQKGVNDNQLQQRFKDMADTSRSTENNSAGPDFRNGYNDTTRTCPICRGDCVVQGGDCPKCEGMGFIEVGPQS